MPELPVLSAAEVIRALERAGFRKVSQRGSHVKMRSPAGRTAIVPMHDEVRRGTLGSILRQAGITAEEFLAILSRR